MTDHISKVQMQTLLKSEYTQQKVTGEFEDCCKDVQPCSNEIAKIATGIEDLYKQNPGRFAGMVAEMESAIEKKCNAIKKEKGMVRQLLTQSATDQKDNSTQVEKSVSNAAS